VRSWTRAADTSEHTCPRSEFGGGEFPKGTAPDSREDVHDAALGLVVNGSEAVRVAETSMFFIKRVWAASVGLDLLRGA
jgi:hypothetical protein